jgi:hypothetical protein
MIYAKPFIWTESNPYEVTAVLDEFVAHPEFLNYPAPPEQARQIGASLLTDPNNLIWTCYNGKDLTGLVILTRIVPRVDALVHFMFVDKELASKRKLLRNLIGFWFKDLGFNRLSMEVPEGVRLERFARKVLYFKLEGEIRPRNPELPASLSDNWVARQGSRRESSYFDGAVWKDIVLLRLLASEWVGDTREVPCQSEPLPVQQPQSSVAPSEDSSEVVVPATLSLYSRRISSP